MKSLKRVQVLFNVLRILAKIGFVCVIIGFSFSILGAVFLGIFKDNGQIIEYVNRYDLTVKNAIGQCLSGTIYCLFTAITLYYSLKLYNNELADGTPFTKSFVHEMRMLAVINFISGVLASIMVAIVDSIFKFNSHYELSGSLIGGAFGLLILSLIFDYGADINKEDIRNE